jgi:hypothetical protein
MNPEELTAHDLFYSNSKEAFNVAREGLMTDVGVAEILRNREVSRSRLRAESS